MLSKQSAFDATRAAEEMDLQNAITGATEKGDYSVEILNLTEYQQSLLTEGGFTFVNTASKLGTHWKITWDA